MRNTPLRSEKGNKDKDKICQDAKMADWVEDLYPLEEYLITACRKRNVKWSFDVTAREPVNFHTINYTTFAQGLFIHPLQPELALKQTYDAIAHSTGAVDYVRSFKERALSPSGIKWHIADNQPELPDDDFSLVVLPGENKIKEKICVDKLRFIEKSGELAIYKPHPFTHQDTLAELREIAGIDEGRMLSPMTHLHIALHRASKVYTTHLSESCAYAVALDKPVEPIDLVQNRELSSFTPINYHLFLDEDPQLTLNRMFNSYKSGYVDPSMDWMERIDDYLDYILSMRERVKHFYIQQ